MPALRHDGVVSARDGAAGHPAALTRAVITRLPLIRTAARPFQPIGSVAREVAAHRE